MSKGLPIEQCYRPGARPKGLCAAALTVAALLLAACSSSPATGTNATGTAPSSTAPGTAPGSTAGGSSTTGPTGSSGTHGSSTTTTTIPPPPAGLIVGPGDVASILASDTRLNNIANSTLSVAVQDSHETCLQAIEDDESYAQERAAGEHSAGTAFEQRPSTSYVPRQTSYPAFFTTLAAFVSRGAPTTENLLTYVKTSPTGHWRLDGSTEILGPTARGVSLPSAARTAGGLAVSLPLSSTDGLDLAPASVAATVATAFDAQALSGKLPRGITAQFGPHDEEAPHSIVASWANAGTATVSFSPVPPPVARPGTGTADCPYPAYRLADGGALVMFPEFTRIGIDARSGTGLLQPASRAQFGFGLAPGTYQSVTSEWLDMMVAVVPPAGSSAPLQVVGQASEQLGIVGATSAPILT